MSRWEEHQIVIAENMKAADLHKKLSGENVVPSLILLTQSVKDPEKKPGGKVQVITEVPDEVATSDMVIDVKSSVAHKKVVSNSTRRTFRTTPRILGEPYR